MGRTGDHSPRGKTSAWPKAVNKLSIPAVDMTPSRLLLRAPWVKSDDIGVARLAAQHFFDRGFRNFAFCGNAQFKVSTRRQGYFKICAGGAGHGAAHGLLQRVEHHGESPANLRQFRGRGPL